MAGVRCLVLSALLGLLPLGAAAQDALTLDQAVQTALAHNASLRAARAGADEASAGVSEARAAFFPRISIAETWQRGDQPVFVFSSLLAARRFGAANFAIDALNHPDPIGFFRTSAGVEQVLFDGGRRRAATTLAALRRDMATASVDQAAAALAVSTTETFGRIVAAQAARRALNAALEAALEDVARGERRRDAGLLTEADVLALRVHIADLEQRAVQTDADADAARAALNRLMGDPIGRPIDVVEPPPTVSADGLEVRDLASLLMEAEAARPEVRRAASAEQAAEVARRQSRAAFVPQAAAQAAFDVSGTRIADRASSWVVGGELRWTFSTGGGERAAVRAAAAAMARTAAEADDARAGVRAEVVSARRRLDAARARQALGRAAVDQAREGQRIVRDRFDAGLAPATDVLRASAAVVDAEARVTSALVDSVVSAAELRRAVGRLP